MAAFNSQRRVQRRISTAPWRFVSNFLRSWYRNVTADALSPPSSTNDFVMSISSFWTAVTRPSGEIPKYPCCFVQSPGQCFAQFPSPPLDLSWPHSLRSWEGTCYGLQLVWESSSTATQRPACILGKRLGLGGPSEQFDPPQWLPQQHRSHYKSERRQIQFPWERSTPH
jgi:hypothetical protein